MTEVTSKLMKSPPNGCAKRVRNGGRSFARRWESSRLLGWNTSMSLFYFHLRGRRVLLKWKGRKSFRVQHCSPEHLSLQAWWLVISGARQAQQKRPKPLHHGQQDFSGQCAVVRVSHTSSSKGILFRP